MSDGFWHVIEIFASGPLSHFALAVAVITAFGAMFFNYAQKAESRAAATKDPVQVAIETHTAKLDAIAKDITAIRDAMASARTVIDILKDRSDRDRSDRH
ncbi:MAG: hypothetical protein U5N55_01490 [Cypionkella sp.]|nr:hypothetical protein [Cypionkella sp.]